MKIRRKETDEISYICDGSQNTRDGYDTIDTTFAIFLIKNFFLIFYTTLY